MSPSIFTHEIRRSCLSQILDLDDICSASLSMLFLGYPCLSPISAVPPFGLGCALISDIQIWLFSTLKECVIELDVEVNVFRALHHQASVHHCQHAAL